MAKHVSVFIMTMFKDDIINGVFFFYRHVQLIKTQLEGKPAYQLQFQLRAPAQSNERPSSALPSITREILFSRTQTKDAGVLTFSEKIKLIVEELVQEAASSIKSP